MTNSHSTTTVAKQDVQGQQVQNARASARDVEVEERSKSASASAGLNLNLFGALSGAFSSSSKKSTKSNPDGSSETTTEKNDRAAASAAAQGNASAYGAANAQEHNLHHKAQGVEKERSEAKAVQGSSSSKKVERVDHLGIES
ncbi:hypothetical protein T440DRAFT_428339 [Plenodomus tracheiphilus IPT5]|uniref:Uncharacterized protein n=1 Tax=Plenodomus tracheiphilus IPT5 TaxID=1408161 RepID=A0A6A7B0R2_9PLEO|nr:hypothetical protein T440DRAFT_428339 [Plenodomus tracheiphilus IPT5]